MQLMTLSAAVMALLLLAGATASSTRMFSHQERYAHQLRAAGLSHDGSTAAGSVLKKFPTDMAGTFFSGGFTNHVVLQRAPQISSVYGVVVGAESDTAVTVTVSGGAGEALNGASITAKVDLSTVPQFGYARWKAVLPAHPAGGNYTIAAACTGCKNASNTAAIDDVTFGDVWFCSGQSNMWLVMHFDTSRNVTYDKVLSGKYQNIRMHTTPHNQQPDDALEKGTFDFFTSPPPPPYNDYGGYPEGGWLRASVGTYANKTCREGPYEASMPACTPYPQPDDSWLDNSLDGFSAACWHFAEQLTDYMEANNETIVPLGLIGSHWGGTMVEMWQPNATLNAQTCKNDTGGDYAPWQLGRWDIDGGALYNGMVLPYVNMSIKGALWWQGENNAFQCHNAGSSWQAAKSKGFPSGRGGGPMACGAVAEHSGYACKMQNLIQTWRTHWSAASGPGATPADFPFGVVSLAGGTSEGNAQNMGAFRYAQSLNRGVLPSIDMPNTFVAQAFDAGDPCAGGNQCCTNKKDGQGGWPCDAGIAPYTGQFMGGIHPRVKRIVGERLAAAARAIAYGDKKTPFTGPVLRSCSLQGTALHLNFDQALLGDDAILVIQATDNAIGWDSDGRAGENSQVPLDVLLLALQWGPESPLEVQINGTNFTDGVWIPAALQAQCNADKYGTFCPSRNGQPPNVITANLHSSLPAAVSAFVTGVRYAWGGNPCCPTVNRFAIPCPPNSCPIQSWNATLPAVPFWASIGKDGNCSWISTAGGAVF